MPSLTTVTLDKEYAFKCQKTIHTRSSFFSFSPSFLDITAALQEYLQFIVSFTYSLLAITRTLFYPLSWYALTQSDTHLLQHTLQKRNG